MALLQEAVERSDAALVGLCRDGDADAFNVLVRRYKDRVYNVVYRFVGNREDAEDVAQETFVRAYRGIQDFRGDAQVYTWLYRIAGNLARNRLRDRSRKGRNRGTSLDALEESAPGVAQAATRTNRTPEDVASERELNAILQQCLDELPDHYRMVFVLRTFDRLSYDEIAECVGCPKGTVKSRLNQARSLLHARLKELAVV